MPPIEVSHALAQAEADLNAGVDVADVAEAVSFVIGLIPGVPPTIPPVIKEVVIRFGPLGLTLISKLFHIDPKAA